MLMSVRGETMPAAEAETVTEPAKRRERGGGRMARRELRSHGSEGLGRPYIVRNIPTYDILSEENLVRIEKTADRILA
jgi:trimethylamine--corrinoid protein Co-methyltransferase